MTLTRWEPSARFGVFRNPMDRMFDEAFGRSARVLRNNGASRYVLPIDMYETADELLVKAHLPGIDPAQVQLNVEKGHLTIQAHIPSEAEQESDPKRRWHYREVWFGDVVRTIPLPASVNAETADAEFKDGVLTLKLQKTVESRPHQIPIKAS